jgi:hypothetical protein
MQITPELIAGSLTVLGGAVLILNKLGLVQFGKERKVTECPAHKELVTAYKELATSLVVIKTQQAANIKLLETGGKQFEKIERSLSYFNRAVAVLLDRSGGIPKGLEKEREDL